MEPLDALERIATLLERSRAGRYKEEAFRKAAVAVRERSTDELRALAEAGTLESLAGIGSSTARVITQALAGEVPEYLARLEAEAAPDAGEGGVIRAALRGDLHLHSDWSDGGATVVAMARRGAELGHDYLALTDHSPSLSVAHRVGGLAKRLFLVATGPGTFQQRRDALQRVERLHPPTVPGDLWRAGAECLLVSAAPGGMTERPKVLAC